MNRLKAIFKAAPVLSSIFLVVLFFGFVVTYWLIELKHFEAVVEHPIIIENIKIDKEGDFTWKIPNGTWNSRKGEGRISLMFKMIPEFRGKGLMDRSKRSLKLKIAVYALRKDGTRIDRLIRNWYFTTDEPFSEAGSRIWGSFGNEQFEYGLAGIWAYPQENVFIHLQITKPDAMLAKGNPRLKISGDYDYAAVPWVGLFVFAGYGILILLIIILMVISCFIGLKIEILGT